ARGQKHAAVLALPAEVRPIRPAEAEIVVARIAVRRDARIARRAQRLVLKVGEERRQAVSRRLIEMAAGAIGLGRIVEEAVAAQLRARQACLAGEPRIELARERMEVRILDLVA